jgi:hypothetical protein
VRFEFRRREREPLVQHRRHVVAIEVRERRTRAERAQVEPVEQQEIEVGAGQGHAAIRGTRGRPD